MATLKINLYSADNPFKFINPIRKYKDNDPYFSVVDNIPIKQLEENILWLKEALDSATVDIGTPTVAGIPTVEISRGNFSELKPYTLASNQNNVVYVNPGRFSARVNDAYNLTPLQFLTRLAYNNLDQIQTWDATNITDNSVKAILNNLISLIGTNALGMNGLTERSFINPFTSGTDTVLGRFVAPPLVPGTLDGSWDPSLLNLTNIDKYPTFFSFLWSTGFGTLNNPVLGRTAATRGNTQATKSDRGLFYYDSDFVKRWRGVARTSIVDVPDVLSATIDNFDPEDFYYTTSSNQTNTSLSSVANTRIDLLFIYSKPVDQKETYINEFTGEAVTAEYGGSPNNYSPRKIIKPELGIIKGAGVRLSFATNDDWFIANPIGSIGNPSILAGFSDQLNTDLGFKKLNVAGSFPSPDDLMNIAPLLAEWLPKRHFALVGQSILPVAYIVVRKDQVNANGIQVINPEDVIDIRPFFRTTELSYNERAGIAAAIPSPSLMNPVATESYVDTQIKSLKNSIQVGSTGGAGTTTNSILLRDQYNELYFKASTASLIQSNPIYFGGRYFGVWPNNTNLRLTGLPPTAPLIAPSAVDQSFADWVEGRFSQNNDVADGIWRVNRLDNLNYSLPYDYIEAYTDQVRWFIFTIPNVPLKIGTVGTETWDVLIEPVQALTINTFVQTSRDPSGYPSLSPNIEPAAANYGYLQADAPSAFKFKKVLPSNIGDVVAQNSFNYTWLEQDTESALSLINLAIGNISPTRIQIKSVDAPTHWFYANYTGNDNNERTKIDKAWMPSWIVAQDFNGTREVNNDFKCYKIAYRRSNNSPLLTRPNGITLDRLFKAPASTYGNSSVDIKVALLVSNRVMVKDIGFKITNMRVG